MGLQTSCALPVRFQGETSSNVWREKPQFSRFLRTAEIFFNLNFHDAMPGIARSIAATVRTPIGGHRHQRHERSIYNAVQLPRRRHKGRRICIEDLSH